MFRQKRLQMRSHANWSHPWSATTMGYTEGFVQIQMRDIPTKFSWVGETHHRVEISPIDIHLAAVLMNNIAHRSNRCLKYALG